MSMFKSNSRVCGLARAGDHYFAAQLEPRAGALFVSSALAGTIGDPADLACLRRLLSSGPCYTAVSGVDEQENVIIRPIVITKDINPRKIAEAVKTQMVEHIHYPDYELTYGVHNLPEAAKGSPGSAAARHVIAAAVSKKALKEEKAWWRARKFPLPALGVYALSWANLFSRLNNTSGRNVLLITPNVWGIDYVLLQDGSLVYYRWVDISMEEEEHLQFSHEVAQTCLYVETAFACKILACLPPMDVMPILPGYETIMFNPLEQEQMRFASGDVKALCLKHQYRACLAIGQALSGL